MYLHRNCIKSLHSVQRAHRSKYAAVAPTRMNITKLLIINEKQFCYMIGQEILLEDRM